MIFRKKLIWWGLCCFLPLLLLGGLLFSPLGPVVTRIGINALDGISIGGSSGEYCRDFSFTDIEILREDGSVVRLARLAVDWEPMKLWQKTLHIKKIDLAGVYIQPAQTVAKKSSQDTENTKRISFIPPVALVLDELIATDFFYDRGVDEDGDPQTSFLFDQIELSATAGRSGVTLKRLKANGPDMAADLHGSLHLASVRQIELGGTFRFAGFGFHSMTGELAVAGPLNAPEVTARLHKPGTMQLTGKLHDLLSNLSWEAELTTKNFDLSSWIRHCPQIVLEKGSANMHGNLDYYQGHALLYGNWGSFDQLRLEGDLKGDDNFIDFATLFLQRQEGEIRADGAWISWEKIFDWRGDIIAKNIDLSLFTSSLSGQFDTVFRTEGEVFTQDLKSVFDITQLQGVIHGQPVSLRGDLTVHENGLESRQLQITSGAVEGTAIVGPAQLNWSQQPGWSAEVLLEKFNPAFLSPDFAGEVNGELNSTGQFATTDIPFAANLEIQHLSGWLRGQKLNGFGSIRLNGERIETDGLTVALGKSSLHLAKANIGTRATGKEQLALSATFHSPDLQKILPGARGALKVSASVDGTREQPAASIELNGENLAWQKNSLQMITGALKLEMADTGRTLGEIKAVGLQLNSLQLQQLDLQLKGRMNDHHLTAKLGGGQLGSSPFSGNFIINGKGHFSSQQWHGELTTTEIKLGRFGTWQQQQKASLFLSNNLFLLENMIFGSNLGRFSATLSSRWGNADTPSGWQANVSAVDVELKSLGETLQWPFAVDGALQAKITLEGNEGQLQTGDFQLLLPHTTFDLSTFSAQSEELKLHSGEISGQLNNGVLQLEGELQEGGGGHLQYDLQLSGIDDPAMILEKRVPLSGNISFGDFDVSMLGNFLSYGQPFGKLTAGLAVSGLLTEPQLSGELSLAGGIGLLAQGISLGNPEISIDADSEGMQLQAQAKSGDGVVKVSGRLGYGQLGRFGRLQIRGRNFLAVDQPEYSFVVNPDMSFHFNEREGSLTGRVDVVSGIIEPNNFTDTVSVSDDVIIVRKGEKHTPGWLFYMDIGVDLGDGVSIDGYGLSGVLGGRLAVKKAPEELFSGVGTLDLRDGKFSMYGRSLDITRGKILFSGGPVDNPGVDVRAEKSMSDQQALGEGYTVGVDISGLVQNLQYRLFSTPPMSETEILSYMILGHSLAGSNAGDESILASAADTLGLNGGSALFGKLGTLLSLDDVHLEGSANNENISLVVGKRLTKNLYVGYDVNMYSQIGQFWVRYELGKGFSVQTFSSAQATGADLLYSFER